MKKIFLHRGLVCLVSMTFLGWWPASRVHAQCSPGGLEELIDDITTGSINWDVHWTRKLGRQEIMQAWRRTQSVWVMLVLADEHPARALAL